MKPSFICPVCKKSFESLSDLMKHAKRTHTEQDILESSNKGDAGTGASHV